MLSLEPRHVGYLISDGHVFAALAWTITNKISHIERTNNRHHHPRMGGMAMVAIDLDRKVVVVRVAAKINKEVPTKEEIIPKEMEKGVE